MSTNFRVFDSVRGTLGFVASARGLHRVYLPQADADALRRTIRTAYPDAVEDEGLLPELADQFQRYFAGERVTFDARLDWSEHTNFEIDVWRACAEIPYGVTGSYKDIAERLGRPGGARAVGLAMAHNPFPIVVPCHRVCKSDGGLGGYSGPGGIDFKQQLLEMEAGAPASAG